jgi:hypothetical protein
VTDNIASLDGLFVHQMIQRYLLNRLLDLLARGCSFEAMYDGCAWFGGEDVPELRFTQLATLMLCRIVVVGVDLYGELRVGIDELCK